MANAARYKPRLIAPAFRGEHPARAQAQLPAPFPALLIPQKAISPPFPPPPHPPNHPAGRPAGSARTRSRVQTLENPFLGSSVRFPPSPVPQNAAGGRPLLVGRPPCTRSAAGQKRNEASPPPARGAGVRRIRANGTGRRHCRPARTRSRVQTLENPFWGAAAVSPQPPSPKAPQAAGPCSWACRSLFHHRPIWNETKQVRPCSWGGRASNPSQRHWPPTPSA